jgi:proprotein convertase subtilisin/kexin type 7
MGEGRWYGNHVWSGILVPFLLHRLLESAMSGEYLHDDFTLPCPPGLKIPEEDGYTITPNTLKVLRPELKLWAHTTILGDLVLGATQGNLGTERSGRPWSQQ